MSDAATDFLYLLALVIGLFVIHQIEQWLRSYYARKKVRELKAKGRWPSGL